MINFKDYDDCIDYIIGNNKNYIDKYNLLMKLQNKEFLFEFNVIGNSILQCILFKDENIMSCIDIYYDFYKNILKNIWFNIFYLTKNNKNSIDLYNNKKYIFLKELIKKYNMKFIEVFSGYIMNTINVDIIKEIFNYFIDFYKRS